MQAYQAGPGEMSMLTALTGFLSFTGNLSSISQWLVILQSAWLVILNRPCPESLRISFQYLTYYQLYGLRNKNTEMISFLTNEFVNNH